MLGAPVWQHAKTVKTALEDRQLLDKRYRMTQAEGHADCIAIPIITDHLETNDELASLVLGYNQQECPRSSASFARH